MRFLESVIAFCAGLRDAAADEFVLDAYATLALLCGLAIVAELLLAVTGGA